MAYDIKYQNERGIDDGGLRREFFSLINKELFDPRKGFFKVMANKIAIQPDPFSSTIPHNKVYFYLAGYMLAKAIQDGHLLDLNLTKSFSKHILDREILISDLEDIDSDLCKNLKWMLENDVDELYQTMTVEVEVLNERFTKELISNGYDTFVTNKNKKDYVKLICKEKMTNEISEQI